MSGNHRNSGWPEQLLLANQTLDAQLKTLLRTEQRLFIFQRDLARKNVRLDALNRFAIDAAALADPAQVLARAASVLFDVYPLDQAVGFLAAEDALFVPVTACAAEGREQPRARADLGAGVRCEPPHAPVVGRFDELRSIAGLAPLFACVERIFHAEPEKDRGALAMVMPLATQSGEAVGLMVLRRLTSPISLHEELPTARDADFLGVLTRLIVVSVTNARLVHDLKISYEKLAQAQRELVHRERLVALGKFATIVAHEVRNPLAVIFNARSLLGRMVHDQEAKRLLRMIGEEAERLARVVGDLIDYARPNPPRLRPEHLLPIIESAVEGVRASMLATSVEIIAEVPPPDVFADARMLRQAIVNLVVNAVQASSNAEPIVVRVLTNADGRLVKIAVEDRGNGVPAGTAERITEPFFTTKATGTGLGLAVVKRVADAHAGQLEFGPREGGGSVFVLAIPIGVQAPGGQPLA